MVSLKLKAKVEIIYNILKINDENNTINNNKSKILKSKIQEINKEKNNNNVIYNKLENIPGQETILSEISAEEKEEILTFLKSIDTSIINQIFNILNSNQFFEKIKTNIGIKIVKNFINETFNEVNLLYINEDEDLYSDLNIQNNIQNNKNLEKLEAININSQNLNNICNSQVILNNNNLGNKIKFSSHVNDKNISNLNNLSNNLNENNNFNKILKNEKNLQSGKKDKIVNSISNTNNNLNKNNNNLITYGDNILNTNHNLINNPNSNNFVLKSNVNSNSENKKNTSSKSLYDFEKARLEYPSSEIKLNDECEVFYYLSEFLKMDEFDSMEIYDLFKYNQTFSLNENILLILFYMIAAYENSCLEEFFNLFSEEIFEFISGEQKFISINRLKDTGRLLGFNEFQLSKNCREIQISSSSISTNNDPLIDLEKFKCFYINLGKKYDMQALNFLTNTSISNGKKKGSRISSDCFSKACNIL